MYNTVYLHHHIIQLINCHDLIQQPLGLDTIINTVYLSTVKQEPLAQPPPKTHTSPSKTTTPQLQTHPEQ